MTQCDQLLKILAEQYNHSGAIKDAIKRKTFFITACPGINADFFAGSTGDSQTIPCLMPTKEEAVCDLEEMKKDCLDNGENEDEFEYDIYQVIYHNINKLEIQSADGKQTYGFQDADSLCGHNLQLS